MIQNSEWEKQVCLHDGGDNAHLTAVTSISCKEASLNRIKNALEKEVALKEENKSYTFVPLDTVIEYAHVLHEKSPQVKNAIEVCNAATIRALDINKVFSQWKKTPALVTFPMEIYLTIFSYLDDSKDVLSFLLISPFQASILDQQNDIWKLLITPMLSLESRKYLKDEDYKRIFMKKVFSGFGGKPTIGGLFDVRPVNLLLTIPPVASPDFIPFDGWCCGSCYELCFDEIFIHRKSKYRSNEKN